MEVLNFIILQVFESCSVVKHCLLSYPSIQSGKHNVGMVLHDLGMVHFKNVDTHLYITYDAISSFLKLI